jgi:hypothetical protein
MNPEEQQVQFINEWGIFSPHQFTVLQRLQSLAHRLSEASPPWDLKVSAQASKSLSTLSKVQSPVLLPGPADGPDEQVRKT